MSRRDQMTLPGIRSPVAKASRWKPKAGDRIEVHPFGGKLLKVPTEDGAWRPEALPTGRFTATVVCRFGDAARNACLVQPDDPFLGTTLASLPSRLRDKALAAGLRDGQDRWYLVIIDSEACPIAG